jgi:hypothetical protein
MKTVRDLIAELSQFPPDMQVIVPTDDGRAVGFHPEASIVQRTGEFHGFPTFRFPRRGEAVTDPLLYISFSDDSIEVPLGKLETVRQASDDEFDAAQERVMTHYADVFRALANA